LPKSFQITALKVGSVMGFDFNDTTSQQMGVKARLVNWVTSPPLPNSFVQIPGKAGVADFGSDSAERATTVKCNIYQAAFIQRDIAMPTRQPFQLSKLHAREAQENARSNT
jgi:hypothetical protein